VFPTLGPFVVAQSDENMQTEQLQCWNGMTDTELSTTSRSNEKEERTIGSYSSSSIRGHPYKRRPENCEKLALSPFVCTGSTPLPLVRMDAP